MATFTIRVYGIVLEDRGLLLSREIIQGNEVVKFPGGGLEFGEGTRSCLIREIREETGCKAIVGAHFYTTDFYQPSAFHTSPVQVLSIYYFITLLGSIKSTSDDNHELFWVPSHQLSPAHVDLPIDKVVVERLIGQLK